jgi:hypothetical protein
MKILDKTCVNSKWVADFLAVDGQEHCECFGSCKVEVADKGGYVFILNSIEIAELEAFEAKNLN